DLNQAIFGRHGECPMPVVAPRSPADCFNIAIEAWRLATRYMTPVIVLSEPWRIPPIKDLERIPVEHPPGTSGGEEFHPYARNQRLGRPWAIPGTPGL